MLTEYGLEGLIDFKWKHLEDGKQVWPSSNSFFFTFIIGNFSFFNMVKSTWQDSSVANTWFEVLSAVHLMAMLTLSEADSMMIPKNSSGSGFRVVSSGFVSIHKLWRTSET